MLQVMFGCSVLLWIRRVIPHCSVKVRSTCALSFVTFTLDRVRMRLTGMYQLSNSRYDAAIDLFCRASEQRPCCLLPRYMKAVCLFHCQRFDTATIEFDGCLTLLEASEKRCSHPDDSALLWFGADAESGEPFPTKPTQMDIMAWASRCFYALGSVQNSVTIVNRIVKVRCSHSNYC